MDYLANHVEALVFCAPKPITEEEIQSCLKEMFDAEVPLSDIEVGLKHIENKFKEDTFSFELVKSGGGYQFLTKPL
ncbi:MAG: SMC-Scp complex subunit ScpB [Bacteroidota bacterium]